MISTNSHSLHTLPHTRPQLTATHRNSAKCTIFAEFRHIVVEVFVQRVQARKAKLEEQLTGTFQFVPTAAAPLLRRQDESWRCVFAKRDSSRLIMILECRKAKSVRMLHLLPSQ